MFVTEKETESVNREISLLQSTLDEAGVANLVNLVKPDARSAADFLQQIDSHTKHVAAGLLIKVIGEKLPGTDAGVNESILKSARAAAAKNVVSALMVLRALSE